MTVAELIEELKKYDPELQVRYCSQQSSVVSREPLMETETESCDVVELGSNSKFVALI